MRGSTRPKSASSSSRTPRRKRGHRRTTVRAYWSRHMHCASRPARCWSAPRALEPLDRAIRSWSGSGPGLLSVHHASTLRQQACKAEAAAAQPLSQPQPQPQPQLQPQPQSQADAQARATAQHAKAKEAQAEYHRLQHHFAQLQQHGRVKGPPWQCQSSAPVAPPQGTPAGSGQLGTPTGGGMGPSGVQSLPSKPAALKVAIQLRLAPQGAAAAVATGSVGCGRGAAGDAATAAAGPQGPGEHRAP